MKFIEKQKALLISSLISGTLLMGLFSMHLTKKGLLASESYYEIQPEKTPEELLKEEIAMNDKSASSTNKAYNETEEFKDVMKNFKSVTSKDFEDNSKLTETDTDTKVEEVTDATHTPSTEDYSVNENELSSYSKINNVIAMRSAKKRESSASNGDNSSNKTSSKSSANSNSSVSYSLVTRTDRHLPPPVYLCEEGGKIVINITVNASGIVTDTYVNTSSSSKNDCLIDSALEYAKNARFSADATKNSQIGSITYFFQGKN